MTREARIYSGHDRPLIDGLIHGTWYPGELRAWLPAGERRLAGQRRLQHQARLDYIDTVPADHVRLTEDDWPRPS